LLYGFMQLHQKIERRSVREEFILGDLGKLIPGKGKQS